MPIPCQLMKPLCLIMGTEKHICLGLTPLGVPAPNPNEICISIGPIYIPLGDQPSPSVSAHTGNLIKRGHDSKFLRPHLSTGLPPLPSAVPPPLDLGLMAIVIGFGQAKAVWGPYSIKAEFPDGAANPAVLFIAPGMCVGAANFSMCSEPMPKMNVKGVQILPNVFNVQVPSTVFAGMTFAAIIGNLVAAIADAVASKLLESLFKYVPGFKWAKEKLEKLAEKILSVALKPLTRRLTQKLTEKALHAVEDRLANEVGMEMSKQVEKKVEDIVEHQVEKSVERLAAKGVDRGIEKLASPLTEPAVDLAGEGGEKGTDWVEEKFGEEGEEGEGGEGEGGEGGKGNAEPRGSSGSTPPRGGGASRSE